MGSSSKDQTVTNKTDIPAFLQPYIQNQAQMSNTALTNLQGSLTGAGANELVAPFNANQQQGQQMAIDAAGNAVTSFNNPNGLAQTGINTLQHLAKGGWAGQMAPQFERGIADGINFDIGQFSLPQNAQTALDQSASGQHLYGNAAFDEAVQASMRAARPSILSGYAQGGSGAIKGGLAQIGMQQAASDAFARLYGDERNRQLGSASQLGNFSLAGRDQELQAQGLRNQAVANLGGVLDSERSRQFAAAQSLPNFSLLGSQLQQQQANTLMDVGDQQQQLAQQQLTAPINAQQMLIAALSGSPQFQSLMGTTSNQPVTRNRGVGAVGGALTGAQLGSMFGPIGTGIGAVGGGLLGAFA